MAIERRFYAPFAAFLAGRGFDVLTWDYRGIGGSRAPREHDAERMAEWGTQDFAGVIDYVHHEMRVRRIAVVGHSCGGQMLGLADNNADVAAALLVAAQGGYWKLWSGLGRARMAFYVFFLLPLVATLLGRGPRALLGSEVPGTVLRDWARWCRTEDYLLGRDGEIHRRDFARVRAPMLALSFSDDFYAPPAAVDWLVRQYSSATVTRRHIAPGDIGAKRIDHVGFFRPAAEETLWRYAATWLSAHMH
jgi:predicted alpha/beta hydrolase